MPNSAMLSTLAGLVLAGTATGVYLGKSAIAQIDPVYFSTPFSGSRFHGDLVPSSPSQDAPPTAQVAGLFEGLGDGCVGCRTYPVEYAPVHDPSVDWPSLAPETLESELVEHETNSPERETIERYAYYQVDAADEPRPILRQAAMEEDPEEGAATDCALANQCEGDPTPGI